MMRFQNHYLKRRPDFYLYPSTSHRISENIDYQFRSLKDHEFRRMKRGFDEHTTDNGVKVQSADRFTIVATENDDFIGCASGLAYKNMDEYSGWFYLTDLFVEKFTRLKGIGAVLLSRLEEIIRHKGVKNIWTWTAGYEAPGFYKKQGYKVFADLENWYSDGSSRIALRKNLLI